MSDEMEEILEAADVVRSMYAAPERSDFEHYLARVVQATPEALIAVAMEAHMLGRIYNKQGEPELPAEVVDRLERSRASVPCAASC